MQVSTCYLVPEKLGTAELGRSLLAFCFESSFDGRSHLVDLLCSLVKAALLASGTAITAATAAVARTMHASSALALGGVLGLLFGVHILYRLHSARVISRFLLASSRA